jgi:hypothetical protein
MVLMKSRLHINLRGQVSNSLVDQLDFVHCCSDSTTRLKKKKKKEKEKRPCKAQIDKKSAKGTKENKRKRKTPIGGIEPPAVV